MEAVRQGIRQGRLAPGQRLIEADLTASLGVSRSSLREALLRLESDGLVEIVRNRSAIVRKLSKRDVQDLMQIRGALESLGANLAALNVRNGEATDELKAVAELWAKAPPVDGFEDFIRENERFHRAIVEASGNDQLIAAVRRLNMDLFTPQFRSRIDLEARTASAEEHRAILRAIMSGDGGAAQTAMAGHIGHTQAQLEAMFGAS